MIPTAPPKRSGRAWSLGLLLVLCGVVYGCAPAERFPNVVLIVVDTLRPDHLGCYGYDVDTSPAIDRLAAQGTLFTRAYATAPWTLPSTGSIMTGQFPRVLGSLGDRIQISADFVSLAELFGERGYDTGAVISHVFVDAEHGFAQGFDSFDGSESGHGHSYISSEGVSSRAADWLRAREAAPFFLFVHYFDPHYNYSMHPELNTFEDYGGRLLDPPDYWGLRNMAAKGQMQDADWRYLEALYDSEIHHTDASIGQLLDVLEAEGHGADTLVVFTADHGEELGEYPDRWIGHTRKLTEAIVHVPLVVRLPGQTLPAKRTAPVSLVDLMPTIAALAGLRIPGPEEIGGRVLDLGAAGAGSSTIFIETERDAQLRSIVDWPWKIVHDLEAGDQRLYNLRDDPLEETDLSDREHVVAARLDAELERVLAEQVALSARAKVRLERADLSEDEADALRALGYTE